MLSQLFMHIANLNFIVHFLNTAYWLVKKWRNLKNVLTKLCNCTKTSGKLQKSMFSKFEDFTSIIVSSEKKPSKAYL